MSATTTSRRRLAAALLLAAAAPAVLSACGTGNNAYTNTQGQSGNGVFATQGSVSVQGATVVLGPEGDRSATLTASFYNAGPDRDALVKVSMNEPTPEQTLIVGDRLELPASKDVRVGYKSLAHVNFYGVEPKAATYVPVTFTFEKAGEITMDLAVVKAEGYYDGIRPVPAAPFAISPPAGTTPTATPAASPSA